MKKKYTLTHKGAKNIIDIFVIDSLNPTSTERITMEDCSTIQSVKPQSVYNGVFYLHGRPIYSRMIFIHMVERFN